MQRAKWWQQFFSNMLLLFGCGSGRGLFSDCLETEEMFQPVQTHKAAQLSAVLV